MDHYTPIKSMDRTEEKKMIKKILDIVKTEISNVKQPTDYEKKSERNEKMFQSLLHDNIQKLEGEFIDLPSLGQYPKGFTLEKASKFYFTKQRYHFFNSLLQTKSLSKGCTLIGPHGVGKSLFTYFLASYAYINHYFLVYIPQVSVWCQKYSSKGKQSAAEYFIDNFMYFNKDLLKEERYKFLKEFFEENENNKPKNYHALQVDLATLLSKNNVTVFYIFDEHQELFKQFENEKGKSMQYAEADYFRPFVQWQSYTHGKMTFTIYCGSSNSEFQFNLPKGEESKKFFVCPPSDLEFLKLSNLYIIIYLLVQTLTKNLDDFVKDLIQKIQRIMKYTGKIPRELDDFLFRYNCDFENYYRGKFEDYQNSLNLWLSSLRDDDRHKFYENLELIFGYKILHKNPTFQGSFYDKGLMYVEKVGSVPIFLNFPVEKVIRQIYIDKVDIPSILSAQSEVEQGILLERHCLKSEMNGNIKKYKTIFTGKSTQPSILQYKMKEVFLFKKDMIFPSETFETTLFIPAIENFPYIDYIIYIPEEKIIIFKQITMSKVAEHLKNKYKLQDDYPNYKDVGEVMHFLFLPSFKFVKEKEIEIIKPCNENGSLSYCQTLIKLITKQDTTIIIQNNEFCVFNNNQKLDVRIIYATGKAENDNGKLDMSIKNIQFYCKDQLKENGVIFEK